MPWFQTRYGNGGLGICVSSVASENPHGGIGHLALASRNLRPTLAKQLFLTVVAGGAIVGAARLLSGISPFVAAPISVIAYVACLWAIGGLGKEQLQMLKRVIKK